ncbi:MAG: flagellar hook-associated protein FlgK [Planctomycetes bacterium]|nr:flagellar hook-associated protein FlgK [Planctomycetota bacterium]
MSIAGALQIGRSALAASQAAMQVAGNNMANAATVGFHRRTIHLAAAGDEIIGRNAFVGQGVQLQSIRREVDTALQSRLRDAISQESTSLVDQRFLTTIETLQNELTDQDLSSSLSEFFNAFSELANNPEDHAIRSLVVQEGLTLANKISSLRESYSGVIKQIDRELGASVTEVNDILDRISLLNTQITQTEQGVGEAAALRDQRDLLINQLSEQLDISVIEQGNGAIDIFVNSVPIVFGGSSRGVELRTESVNGQIEVSIRVKDDGTLLNVNSGRIGGLMRQREDSVQPAIDDLDLLASELIYQINRTHSQGQGKFGFDSVTGSYGVDDVTAALNSTNAGLDFDTDNGSFFIHVTNKESGIRTTYQINVDGSTDSLNDLINEINVTVGVPNVTASVGVANTLSLAANSGYEISFSDDTSGALASLGINTFFDGADAGTIKINSVVENDPNFVAVGAGHIAGSNDTALALAGLEDDQQTNLSNKSIRQFWQDSVTQLAVKTSAANSAVSSSNLVRGSLDAQVQASSGVSLDEEAINLLTYQRQFQAAARFIAVIDETLQTLLSII